MPIPIAYSLPFIGNVNKRQYLQMTTLKFDEIWLEILDLRLTLC